MGMILNIDVIEMILRKNIMLHYNNDERKILKLYINFNAVILLENYD